MKNALQERDMALNELKAGKEKHEKEVNLRLRFEEKLNNLHSMNRSFQEAAIKANEDL